MSPFRGRVGRILDHTRVVPTRLYRLMVLAWGVSGLLQFYYGAPESVIETAPGWMNWTFVIVQMCAVVTILTGLYLVDGNIDHATKLHRSLGLEIVGIIELQTVIAWQIAASWINQDRVPSSGAIWMAALFGGWAWFRLRDAWRTQKSLAQ